METTGYWLLCLPFLTMLATVLVPSHLADRRVQTVRRVATTLAGLNAVAATVMLVLTMQSGPIHFVSQLTLPFSIYLTGTSALMLMLVASVGWVICRFSVRYLDGEQHQGRYFRWTTFTIGAVSLVVVTGNLAVLIAALLLTSLGLHQLLVHYTDRPAATRPAAIKFVFSRLGDLCLLCAAVALFREFGTLEIPELLSAVAASSTSSVVSNPAIAAAGWLIVFCAIFKSAQFPFHTWLPETMEAPTPVSALMHAGIVNAGGYLLIRLAPIVSLTPAALWFVAGLGAFTALLAALVMLSQTSVKRRLAWSTIAQMGFMMLQCGLGAFSAAMLHIIAHSLYKAHAFLGSGSVIAERKATAMVAASPVSNRVRYVAFAAAAITTAGLWIGLTTAAGMTAESKPGALVLGFVMCLSLAHWMWRLLQNGRRFALPAVAISTGLISAYLLLFAAVDFVVAPDLINVLPAATTTGFMIALAFGFAALFIAENLAARPQDSSMVASPSPNKRWLEGLYVHSSNGFYIDAFWKSAAKSFSS